VVRWFLDADDNEDSPRSDYYFLAHLQCSLKFACKFILWYLHYVDKLTSKKYAKTVNLLCASNNVFVKYQAQGGGLTPTPLAHAIAEYKLSALQVSISEEIQATLRYSSSQLQKYQAAY